MSRTMFDSITPTNCPAGAPLYAGYVDGRYSNMAWLAQTHPGAILVSISAIGVGLANVVDCEPGCVWPPANVIPWVRRARANGIDPTVYCGRSNWPAVIAAFAAAGEPEPYWWVAHYTNIPHFCSSSCYSSNVGNRVAIATQYGGDLTGGYDINVVQDYWPGIDSGLSPSGGGGVIVATGDQEEVDMTSKQVYAMTDDDGAIWALGVDGFHHISPEEWTWLSGQGYLVAGSPERVNNRARDLMIMLHGNADNSRGVDANTNFISNETQMFRLYGDADANSPTTGGVYLARPGLWWWVPSMDYLSLIQQYRLAANVINVSGDGSGNVFGFLKSLYLAGTNEADVSAILDKLNAMAAGVDPTAALAALATQISDVPANVVSAIDKLPGNSITADDVESALRVVFKDAGEK